MQPQQININELKLPEKVDDKFIDTRNMGMKRFYFYLNKITGELFALDSELQASHLHRHKQFPYNYLGWTDGKRYYEELLEIQKEIRNKVKQELAGSMATGELRTLEINEKTAEILKGQEYKERIFECLKREAIRAQQNPLSSQSPRNFRQMDLHGNPKPLGQVIAEAGGGFGGVGV